MGKYLSRRLAGAYTPPGGMDRSNKFKTAGTDDPADFPNLEARA